MTSFNAKIEQSSLGAKKAVQARNTVPTRTAASVVHRAIVIRTSRKSPSERGGK